MATPSGSSKRKWSWIYDTENPDYSEELKSLPSRYYRKKHWYCDNDPFAPKCELSTSPFVRDDGKSHGWRGMTKSFTDQKLCDSECTEATRSNFSIPSDLQGLVGNYLTYTETKNLHPESMFPRIIDNRADDEKLLREYSLKNYDSVIEMLRNRKGLGAINELIDLIDQGYFMTIDNFELATRISKDKIIGTIIADPEILRRLLGPAKHLIMTDFASNFINRTIVLDKSVEMIKKFVRLGFVDSQAAIIDFVHILKDLRYTHYLKKHPLLTDLFHYAMEYNPKIFNSEAFNALYPSGYNPKISKPKVYNALYPQAGEDKIGHYPFTREFLDSLPWAKERLERRRKVGEEISAYEELYEYYHEMGNSEAAKITLDEIVKLRELWKSIL